jgi:hypothetical protein
MVDFNPPIVSVDPSRWKRTALWSQLIIRVKERNQLSSRRANRNRWISYQAMKPEEQAALADHEYARQLQAKVEAARARRWKRAKD